MLAPAGGRAAGGVGTVERKRRCRTVPPPPPCRYITGDWAGRRAGESEGREARRGTARAAPLCSEYL